MASSSDSVNDTLRPGHVLFGVNSSGRILRLDADPNTNGNDRVFGNIQSKQGWKELTYLGIEFKRASAARNSLWAVGGDHQLYVMVFGVEVPIRVKEETHENQRWNPMDGFSGTKLLPTDRRSFSTVDGLKERTKESIRLPSMAWQWESNWYLETTFNRQKLDDNGWTYAVDFPAEYHSKKSFTSCVRRRKWIRYRRYIATNTWSQISSIHKDPSEDPFMDVSIGGHDLPNGNPEEGFVWAVTVTGRVYVRQGVTIACPEGLGWLHIPIPDKCEVSQINVGPTGLVWAVTWHGKALVRTGVTRLEPNGVGWSTVDAPEGNVLTHVGVGENVIWALTRDKRIWFRNGIRGIGAGESESLAKGVKWIEMVGHMHMLTIGVKDQVMGIIASRGETFDSEMFDNEDRSLVLRTDVSTSDSSGKTWKQITAPVLQSIESETTFRRRSRRTSQNSTKSNISTSSDLSKSKANHSTIKPSSITTIKDDVAPVNTTTSTSSVAEGSSNDNFKKKASWAGDMVAHQVALNATTAVASATLGRIPVIGGPLTMITRELVRQEIKDVKVSEGLSKQLDERKTNDPQPNIENNMVSMYASAMEDPNATTKTEGGRGNSEPHFNESGTDGLKHSERECSSLSLESNGAENNDHLYEDLRLDLVDREELYGDYYGEVHGQKGPTFSDRWVWLAAGTCCIDSGMGNMLSVGKTGNLVGPAHWFVENTREGSIAASESTLPRETWQENILNKLRENNDYIENEKDDKFSSYELAVEKSSWVRKVAAKVSFGGGNNWENCVVELEQTGTPGEVDFGTLSVFGTKKHKEHLSLSEITCVVRYSDEKTLGVFTSIRAPTLAPLQLKFSGDIEMETWQADIVRGMNSVRYGSQNIQNKGNSLFAVTTKGEVCAFNASVHSNFESLTSTDATKIDMKENEFTQEIPVTNADARKMQSSPFMYPLENSFSPGSALFVTAKIHENADRFEINLQTGRFSDDTDICLHFNPRLQNNQVVLNHRRNGEWGVEEKQPLIIMIGGDSAVKAFNPGHTVHILIECTMNYFQVKVNGTQFARFNHRIRPEEITHFRIGGDIDFPSPIIYHSKFAIIPPSQMFWRTLGAGHLLQVESCIPGDVTWGLGYDSTAWVYTGGWGGGHFKGDSSKIGINSMEDARYFYVYENQRWNPLTGFTSHGLPTDRYSWSDKSGRHCLTKDMVKLPSIHWQWATEWLADYYTPGGVDKDGWQYATDFPASYHGKSGFTDYVRRRRWARKAKLFTSGPWKRLGSTKLLDITMLQSLAEKSSQFSPKSDPNEESSPRIHLWAIASNGDALYRDGVSTRCPEGTEWIHVKSDSQFQSISIGRESGGCIKVWAISKDGIAFLRHGVSDKITTGQLWIQVHPPNPSTKLRMVTVGDANHVWALDTSDRLYIRQETSSPAFPEGSSWLNVPVASATGAFHAIAPNTPLFKSISAHGKELWAILDNVQLTLSGPQWSYPLSSSVIGGVVASGANTLNYYVGGSHIGPVNGVIAKMTGITTNQPTGTGWDIAIGGGWKHICIRGRQNR